jgi:hypothetical protein
MSPLIDAVNLAEGCQGGGLAANGIGMTIEDIIPHLRSNDSLKTLFNGFKGFPSSPKLPQNTWEGRREWRHGKPKSYWGIASRRSDSGMT